MGPTILLGMEFSSEWRVKTFHNFMVKVGIYSETTRASNRLLDRSLDMIPQYIKRVCKRYLQIISAVSNNEHSLIDVIESNLNTEDEVRSSNGYLQDAGSTDTNACRDLVSSTRQAVMGKCEDNRMNFKNQSLPVDLAMTSENDSCFFYNVRLQQKDEKL